MKYLAAVSGGVDSVVLLDMLIKAGHDVIVAHVEHGIRGEESRADARFVNGLANKYGVKFVSKSLELGKGASEELAREKRYEFLFDEAKKNNAKLVTAHHADDVVETVILNLQRGTGWRGLAVLARKDIERPLLNYSKSEIYKYAIENKLEWVEDETNCTDKYHRNRIRHLIPSEFAARSKIVELRNNQVKLRNIIENEALKLLKGNNQSLRYFLSNIDAEIAREILGIFIYNQCGVYLQRPQLSRGILAIKTAKNDTVFEIGDGVKLVFTPRNFFVQLV